MSNRARATTKSDSADSRQRTAVLCLWSMDKVHSHGGHRNSAERRCDRWVVRLSTGMGGVALITNFKPVVSHTP